MRSHFPLSRSPASFVLRQVLQSRQECCPIDAAFARVLPLSPLPVSCLGCAAQPARPLPYWCAAVFSFVCVPLLCSAWAAPDCYYRRAAGDAKHPAADIASQTAAALALLSRWLERSDQTTQSDKRELAPLLAKKAKHAFEYALAIDAQNGGDGSGCTASDALDNCVGNCTLKTIDPPLLQVSSREASITLFPC